jgi:monoterpene epsilon-lactone hydrolase
MRPRRHLTALLLLVSALGAAAADPAPAPGPAPAEQPPNQPPNQPYYIPPSISPQARAFMEKMLPIVIKAQAARPEARTAADFEERRKQLLAGAEAGNAPVLKALGVSVADAQMAGVGVVETRPPQYQDDGTVLLHVHGGGFVQDSARSAIRGDALMAVKTGKRIISVDYTLAPEGHWPLVTDQVIGVYKALLGQGYPAHSIGMFGDSAGGNIVAASTLKLRDQGVAMPGALVLLSPGLDVTMSSDTWTTLHDADPVLNRDGELKLAFSLYADPADWKNPYVSPLYGDFSKGYPPVLFQAGTKERVLSDSVRMYQELKAAGIDTVLDIYEGMPHGFQGYLMGTPEQTAAYAEMRKFWLDHLVPRKPS